MIDTVFQIVKTVLNKELRGNITPDEFNKVARQVQEDIFAGYFGQNAMYQNKQNKGYTGLNHANMPQKIRQKIDILQSEASLTLNGDNNFDLPTDLYYINDRGLTFGVNTLIDEIQSNEFAFLSSSSQASETFPTYKQLGNEIKVLPATITSNVKCSYIRKPLAPKWTYMTISDIAMYNAAAVDHQDFELHPSELPNIVINMLSYFGLNLGVADVTAIAEEMKQKKDIKDAN